ncbi:MAG: hypothetical protein JNJ99_03140, partial [Crocinitomicaceae bacterium]|nr:hypothetical protein [Crocinitomicaceae bacterium]
MFKGLLTVLLFVFSCYLFAQPGGERPKIGTLTGQVIEEVSKKSIPYAKVFL